MQTYTTEFYTARSNGSQSSAREIVPYIIDLIQPQSVVDIGCGTGTWLSVFQAGGISNILGIDGDYVDRTLLQIPLECFSPYDLTKPLNLDRRFDLAVSLEVAEHLPEDKARQFIDSLVRLSNVVLFSAAIPHQPGDDHINCQWIEYWAEIFDEKGFILIDCIRLKFWQNLKVDYWYAQNMFLAIEKTHLGEYNSLNNMAYYTGNAPPALVHPETYLYQQSLAQACAIENISIRKALSLLITSIGDRFKKVAK